ncbi:MAG: hypothetical protein ABI623_00225 [bacterium]
MKSPIKTITRSTDIPNGYLEAIGGIALETAWIESSMVYLISWIAFETPNRLQKAECLVGGENFSVLLKKLEKLLLLTLREDEKLIKRFNDLKKRINHINSARNEYLHSSWQSISDDIGSPLIVNKTKVKKDMNSKFEMRDEKTVSLDTIRAIWEEGKQVNKDFVRFSIVVLAIITKERKRGLRKSN